jgi:uncharacterized protein YodC (DUF2158 family)
LLLLLARVALARIGIIRSVVFLFLRHDGVFGNFPACCAAAERADVGREQDPLWDAGPHVPDVLAQPVTHGRATGRRTSGDNRRVAESIRVGDSVVLKSGGPVMTVQAVSMSLAYCAWSVGNHRRQGTFETESLQPADAREPDPQHGEGGREAAR